MSRLPLPIKRALRDPAPDLARTWAAVVAGGTRRSRRRVLVLGGALGAAATVAALAWLPPARQRAPLALADGRPLATLEAAAGAPLAVALSDGSHLSLAAGTRVEAEPAGGAVALRLLRGTLVADVRPGGGRRWSVDAGLAVVEVVGTRFTVEREEGRLRVTVERGLVVVRGARVPGGMARLGPGSLLQVTAAPATQVAAASLPAAAVTPAGAGAAAAPSRPASVPGVAPTSRPPAPEGWAALARGGAHADAYRALGRDGLAAAARGGPSTETLLALADVARLSGHPGDAVAPLEAVVRRHPREPRGALAAFTLGRVQLEQLRDYRAAADDFAQALGIGLPAGLEEDAWVRLVEARVRAGDGAAARAAARGYERRFPRGRHHREVQRWLEGG
jgi:transmembrane sensor